MPTVVSSYAMNPQTFVSKWSPFPWLPIESSPQGGTGGRLQTANAELRIKLKQKPFLCGVHKPA